MLVANDLPDETPDWVADAAPMVAANTEELVDTAITNAETVADVRQTLDNHPAATEYLRETVERDQDEHVIGMDEVHANQRAYRAAQRAQTAAQPSRGERVREALPFVADPDTPEYDGPAPDEIEGPLTEDALPAAVTDHKTAADIRGTIGRDSPPDYLVAAEQQANTAVKEAETAEELCQGLHETPGAHKDVANAMETVYTHLPEKTMPDGRDLTRERSADLSQNEDRGPSMGW